MIIEYGLKNLSRKEYNECNQLIDLMRQAEEDGEDTNMDEQQYNDIPSKVKESHYTKTPAADWKLTGLTFEERRAALDAVAAFRKSRRRRVVTFTETGEVRLAKKGEYYLESHDDFLKSLWNTNKEYPIYIRTESFIEQEKK